MDLHLTGKRVLITGASKGIGLAAARAFAAEGCDLYLTARSADLLAHVAETISSRARVSVDVFPTDLRDPDNRGRLVEQCGDIDILVNNAGDIPGGRLDQLDDAAWRSGWELKVFGYIDMARQVYARMRERGQGVIINDIGAAGERFDAGYIAGSTGNAALMAFTRALGGRCINDGIRVVGINPGLVATDRSVMMLRAMATSRFGDADRVDEVLAQLPGGRCAEPAEIADAMVFLASDRSAYTSGVILTIDGGLCAAGGQ